MNGKRSWRQVTWRVEGQLSDISGAIWVRGGPMPSQRTLASVGTRTPVLYAELHHQPPCFAGRQELPEESVNADAVVVSALSLPVSVRSQGWRAAESCCDAQGVRNWGTTVSRESFQGGYLAQGLMGCGLSALTTTNAQTRLLPVARPAK